MAFSQIIYQVTVPQPGGEPIMSVAEAARVMGVSESTIYDYRHDRTEPAYSKIKALAHKLNRRGYHKLSLQFFDNGAGRANGSTQDETIAIVRELGRIESGADGQTIVNAGGEIKRQANNLIKEGEQL